MPELSQQTMLYVPTLTTFERDDWTIVVDGETPNWVSTGARGTWLLRRLGESPRTFSALVSEYASRFALDTAKAWVHVQSFVSEAIRHGIISLAPIQRPLYLGRAQYLTVSRLRECWLHTNNSCNLSCAHCLVNSSPRGEPGLPADTWKVLIDQAVALGVERFYITGGEPFVRPDMPELVRDITEHHERELIILTNAIVFGTPRRAILDGFDPGRVKFQVSVDGSTPEINDPIRGKGSFHATVAGLRELSRRDFEVTLTTVATGGNLEDLPNLTRLAESCRVRNQHLMWIHRRGRVTDLPAAPENGNSTGTAQAGLPAAPEHEDPAGTAQAGEQNGWSHHLAGAAGGSSSADDAQTKAGSRQTGPAGHSQVAGWFPSTERLIDAVRAVKHEADRLGVALDNAASFELRANAPSGIKFDLGNAGWQSLCIYANGHVYPSAAFANHPPLDCGDVTLDMHLEQMWRMSPVLEAIRHASVARKAQAVKDPLRYLIGGGDIEHSYFFSGDFLGDDPYYPLYQTLLLDAMDTLTARKASLVNRRSGYDAPRIYHAMGDGAVVCGTTEFGSEDVEVAFLHSNCVLSFDVEKPRKIIQQFYGQAAEQPQAELCCPTKYDPDAVGHIPQEVLDRFYGCGSPVTSANVQPGDIYVDLGSGAGIDCFIAAKYVGPVGRVIGVDMTDQMLAVARENQPKVAQSLGYDVVEFRKGYLEALPLEDKTAHVITSNCVINLSPDKPKVFAQIWRVLKDHGRTVIADIVSDREVPPRLKINEQLWGECIVGALTEEQFLAMLEQAGFYGLSVLKKTYWKTIEGYNFYSVTVQGFKFEKTQGCTYIGQTAIYRGPFKAVLDEEGHMFPRNIAISVCTDTASKLSRAPYAGFFTVVEPDGKTNELAFATCRPSGNGQGCC